MTEIEPRELERLRAKAAETDRIQWWIKMVGRAIATVILVIVLVVILFRVIGPQLNLYKANTEKRAVIAEQKAISEAAEYAARSKVTQANAEAEAEIARAKGAAQAQAIIAETLTPEYLRYLYIQTLAVAGADVIYVPTEAGLPITEAGRTPASAQEGG